MLKNNIKAVVLKNLYKSCLVTFIGALVVNSAQASIGISTPSVNSGELIRASDWNKVKLDLETIAAAVGSLQNQSWDSSGSDTFYDAGNVGIGINAPTGTLHLFADTPASNAVLLQLGTTDDADRVRIDEDGDMTIDGKLVVRDSDIYESGGDLELSGEDSLYLSMDWNNDDGDTQNLYFGKNDDGAGANFVELMRLTEAGDLSVGVATPLSKVHVAGAVQIGGDAAPCVAAKAGAIRYDGGAVERCDGANWDALATTNVSDNLGSHVAEQNINLDAFRLVGEGGTEGLAIDVNGTVGIGTDNPTTLLDVTNDQTPVLTVRTTAVNGQNAAVTITGAQTTSTTADVASIRLNNKDGAPFEGARISLRNGDGSDSTSFGDLVFSTNTGGADNLSEKMRILDTGAVGIGTSSPAAQLQVLKNGPVPNEIVFQVGTNSDDRRFYVDEDGDFYSDGNAFVTGSLRSENSGLTVGSEDSLYLVTDWNDNDAENRSIIFGKNGVGGGGGFTELARFNENGRFGLGENNPANLLHVGATETADRVAVIENLATTGSPEGLLVLTGQGAGPAPAFAVGTGVESSHTNNFVVTNDGNVGVGTTNPGETLEVSGNVYLNDGYLKQDDIWGMKWQFAGASDTVEMNQAETAWKWNIAGGGVTKYRFNTTKGGSINGPILDLETGGDAIFYGNVGIGTTSPGDTLHVLSDSNAPAIIESADSISGINLKDSNGDNYLYGWLGKFGLNDETPDATLEVVKSASNDYLNLSSTTEGDGDILNIDSNGEANFSSISSDGTGKVVCIKSDGNLGTCTDAPNGSGVCSCS